MIIDGKAIAANIIEELKDVAKTKPSKKVCFINFKKTPEAEKFLKVKTSTAEKIGVETKLIEKDAIDTTQAINLLNEVMRENYDGIVLQLPFPREVDEDELFDLLPVEKDIDLLSHHAKALFFAGTTSRVPPVACAVKEILKQIDFEYKDKNILILGQGKLVGEPVSLMFKAENIPHNVADIHTPKTQMENLLHEADLVISGIGVPHFIKPDMIKVGVVLIDAGTSEQSGKIAGDASPDCAEVASVFTPVPGGVGPVTVACLFRNLFQN